MREARQKMRAHPASSSNLRLPSSVSQSAR
jgi:hypothetical protein